jgi:transposase InsO family protein
VPLPSSSASAPKPSLLLALLCASVVAAYNRDWLARPVVQLIPADGPRPERLSRLKALLLARLEALVEAATRRGRPPVPRPAADTARAGVLAALLTVASKVLAATRGPRYRRDLQDHLVAAYDRLHAAHGVTQVDFCTALAIPVRTFRVWHTRPARPPAPAAPPPPPRPPRPDRATGRFALEITAPGTQLGGDTTDLRVLGIDLKLTAAQDLGAREQRLWEAFAIDETETAALVTAVVTAAAADRPGLQFLTDQGKPFMAQATRAACEALGVEHTPQREHTPTEKATVERAFATAKQALAPLLDLLNQLAAAVPALARPDLAKLVGTLLLTVFLRVYAAGRRHLQHPLAGHDPAALGAIIAAQRDHAHAEQRSTRLLLEGVHTEYAFPGGREDFVRAFKHYPLEDLQEAERRFRRYACRCVVRHCDRYFAAVVRDVYDHARPRRAAEHARVVAAATARREEAERVTRVAWLDQHPEVRLHEGLDLLAATWQPERQRFLMHGACARIVLQVALRALAAQSTLGAHDEIERHWRNWLAAQPTLPLPVRAAVRSFLDQLVVATIGSPQTPSPASCLSSILDGAARASPDNLRPPLMPDLRI